MKPTRPRRKKTEATAAKEPHQSRIVAIADAHSPPPPRSDWPR